MRSSLETGKLSLYMVTQIDRAVETLKQDGIVAFPTDTIYGLGAGVFNDKAVAKIYQVKQRPRNLALPVLLADVSQVSVVASSVSGLAQFLMKRFWPGGLTLVLSKANALSDSVTACSGKVAVRVPNHLVPITIIRKLGMPVIGTSANISDKPAALTAQEVEAQLGSKVDLIINGGRCPGGKESTVVDITGEAPVILRQGIISDSDIVRVYNEYNREADK